MFACVCMEKGISNMLLCLDQDFQHKKKNTKSKRLNKTLILNMNYKYHYKFLISFYKTNTVLASFVHRKHPESVTNPSSTQTVVNKEFQFLGETANPGPETRNTQEVSGTALHTRNKGHYQRLYGSWGRTQSQCEKTHWPKKEQILRRMTAIFIGTHLSLIKIHESQCN